MIENHKKLNIKNIFVLLLIFLSLITSIFAIYELLKLSSIENLIRYIVIIILIIIDIFIILKGIFIITYKNRKKRKTYIFIIISTLYSTICSLIAGGIFYLLSQLNNINTGLVTYSSSLISLSNNKISTINEVKNYKIGILNNKESPDGYVIPREIIDKYKLEDENEIIKYDDYSSMITDLYLKDVDLLLLPSTYYDMFKSITGYENIKNDTKVIISLDKEMKKKDVSSIETSSSGKDITEPFTILLMGIDSTNEELKKNAVANGDTLILVTFNPKTLNATMLSIPRDSYVPIACWSNKARNKITHAAGYGTECMMKTIENYLDINIDYYAKINFKGLVKLVDAVDGIQIDVKQRLCTDNSNREEQVCINPGYQTLNGEQALVYVRNRHDLVNGDFGRNQHQQEVIMALTNKFKSITSVTKFLDIINTISNSLDTNLTQKQMLSFYNIGKDIIKKSLSSNEAELINIIQLYLAGNDQRIYDERIRMVLYNYIPNENSRKDIVKAMKQNLGLIPYEEVKEFKFNINEPYEKNIIGKGPYKTNSLYRLLPDFTGDSMETARNTCRKLGIKVIFDGDYGYVTRQSYPAFKRIDLINDTLKLTLSGKKSEDKNDTKPDNNKEPEKPNKNDNDKEQEKPNKNDNDKEPEKPNKTDNDKEPEKPNKSDTDKEPSKPNNNNNDDDDEVKQDKNKQPDE